MEFFNIEVDKSLVSSVYRYAPTCKAMQKAEDDLRKKTAEKVYETDGVTIFVQKKL